MRWLFRPEGNRWNMKEIDIPLLSSDEASYVLQRLLLLSKEQLYNHTVHRFAAPLEYASHKTSQGDQKYSQQVSTSTQQKLLSSSTLKTHFLRMNFIRVCPLCLQEQESYDRLYWRLQIILFCPYHRMLLVEKCPECRTPIIAHRRHAFICHKCHQGDYRTRVSTPIASDNPYILGELLFLHMLGIAIPECQGELLSLKSSPLFTLSNTSYMHLFRHIAATIEHFFTLQELAILGTMHQIIPEKNSAPCHDLLSSKSALAFVLFHWLFLDWPTHFTTFLDVWYSLTTPPYTGEHPEPVRVFGRYLFSDPATYDGAEWLHETYQSYHTQFHNDSIRIDYLRQEVNQRAQLIHVQQNVASAINNEQEKTSTAEFDTPLFVPPRVLTPIRPYPWESLTSALSRAAIRMNHPCPEQLLNSSVLLLLKLMNRLREVSLSFQAKQTIQHLLIFSRSQKRASCQLSHSPLIMSLGLPPYDLGPDRSYFPNLHCVHGFSPI